MHKVMIVLNINNNNTKTQNLVIFRLLKRNRVSKCQFYLYVCGFEGYERDNKNVIFYRKLACTLRYGFNIAGCIYMLSKYRQL